MSENRWIKLYVMSYFNLNPEIISFDIRGNSIWLDVLYDLIEGFFLKMLNVPCLTKNHLKLFFDAFNYSFLGL